MQKNAEYHKDYTFSEVVKCVDIGVGNNSYRIEVQEDYGPEGNAYSAHAYILESVKIDSDAMDRLVENGLMWVKFHDFPWVDGEASAEKALEKALFFLREKTSTT